MNIVPISNEICKARLLQGLNMKALAKKAGVSPATISNIEHSMRPVYPANAKKICEALGKPFDELFVLQD